MSILQTKIADNDINDSKAIATNPEAMKRYWQRERNLRISQSLQIHFEIPAIINAFAEALQAELSYDSFSYDNSDINQQIIIGASKAHSIQYKLTIENQHLGTIKLSRHKRFSEVELIELEEILCMLIYPLRNGINYHQAIQKSSYDVLTGVSNRNSLINSLRHEWELSHRHNSTLSLLIIDIDYFKSVNDTFGHLCGDLILKQVAEKISDCVRESDLVYRYGGDEFTVILRETEEEGALILAERIREAVAQGIYDYKGEMVNMTVSIGLSCNHHKQNSNETDLLDHADQALYRAKNEGRNLVSL